ncbi:MAG: hypothetical protein Q7S39_02955 [Ignavibacteria bacterium]|nr:hypothetical protein [Ignavibacteria bacterium]
MKKIISKSISFLNHSPGKIYFYNMLIIISLFLPGCKDEITSPPEKPIYTKVLKGKVILENQTEHSNALVYLDSLNRGIGTDSSGNYSIQFTEEDTIYNGVFKIYFFVNEFEMDSAQYVLVNGKVKLDSLDVDSEGNLPTKELGQLLLIEGWTDKQEYRIGDTIAFTAKFTNVSDRTVHIFIYSIFNELGHVGLYNENYHSFPLTPPCIITNLDADIFIQPNGFYEGNVVYTIPGGYSCGDFIPLPFEDFIVYADLFIEGRLLNFWTNRLDNFIGKEWFKLHRGKTPKLDPFPNKYKYPIIKIIQ